MPKQGIRIFLNADEHAKDMKDIGGIIVDRDFGFSIVGEGDYWYAKFFNSHIAKTDEKKVLLWEIVYDPNEIYAKKMKEILGKYLTTAYGYEHTIARAEHLAREVRPKLEQLFLLHKEDKNHPDALQLVQYIDKLFDT
jgi:hypothetical protein